MHYDVAIIGIGAVGSAALYQCSKLDLKVAGFDCFKPPHIYGSSHGESRIIRQAIGENIKYSELSIKSYAIWNDLEKLIGTKLIHDNGGLIISPNNMDNIFFERTLQAAKKYDIAYELLNTDEIIKRFPEFSALKNVHGYYEHNAGFVVPELIISTQIDIAHHNGAELYYNEAIVEIVEDKQNTISLKTQSGKIFTASKVIIAAGPWIHDFLPDTYKNLVKVYRQILYWFEIIDYNYFSVDKFPVFIMRLPNDEGGIYGFPAINGPQNGFKVATHNVAVPIEQDAINRQVNADEIHVFYEKYIQPYFSRFVSPRCLKSSVCSYSMTPDEGFIIDFAPNTQNIVIVSACSGHGFKHSAAVGEIATYLLLGKAIDFDMQIFSINRFM